MQLTFGDPPPPPTKKMLKTCKLHFLNPPHCFDISCISQRILIISQNFTPPSNFVVVLSLVFFQGESVGLIHFNFFSGVVDVFNCFIVFFFFTGFLLLC